MIYTEICFWNSHTHIEFLCFYGNINTEKKKETRDTKGLRVSGGRGED